MPVDVVDPGSESRVGVFMQRRRAVVVPVQSRGCLVDRGAGFTAETWKGEQFARLMDADWWFGGAIAFAAKDAWGSKNSKGRQCDAIKK